MTREDIIAWAREAGMVVVDDVYSLLTFLERFAALAYAAGAEAEREECAMEAEKQNCHMVAHAIRVAHGIKEKNNG